MWRLINRIPDYPRQFETVVLFIFVLLPSIYRFSLHRSRESTRIAEDLKISAPTGAVEIPVETHTIQTCYETPGSQANSCNRARMTASSVITIGYGASIQMAAHFSSEG